MVACIAVTVLLEREGDAAVTEALGHHVDANLRGEELRRVAVPKVVEPDPGEAGGALGEGSSASGLASIARRICSECSPKPGAKPTGG